MRKTDNKQLPAKMNGQTSHALHLSRHVKLFSASQAILHKSNNRLDLEVNSLMMQEIVIEAGSDNGWRFGQVFRATCVTQETSGTKKCLASAWIMEEHRSEEILPEVWLGEVARLILSLLWRPSNPCVLPLAEGARGYHLLVCCRMSVRSGGRNQAL